MFKTFHYALCWLNFLAPILVQCLNSNYNCHSLRLRRRPRNLCLTKVPAECSINWWHVHWSIAIQELNNLQNWTREFNYNSRKTPIIIWKHHFACALPYCQNDLVAECTKCTNIQKRSIKRINFTFLAEWHAALIIYQQETDAKTSESKKEVQKIRLLLIFSSSLIHKRCFYWL